MHSEPLLQPQRSQSQQAGSGGGRAAASGLQPAAMPAASVEVEAAPPLQLLPGFNLWLMMHRPPLQLMSVWS